MRHASSSEADDRARGSARPRELVRPDRDRFLELAAEHDVVPVIQELTSDTVTPYTIWSRMARAGRNAFLLESVEGGDRVARFSFIGADPCHVVEIRRGTAYVDGEPQTGEAIEVLRKASDWGRVAPVEDLPPFAGGALGYMGYDAVRLVEDIPDSCRDEGGLPEAWFGLYDALVAVDRARQRLLLVVAARTGPEGPGPERAWDLACSRLAGLRAVLSGRSALSGGRGAGSVPPPSAVPVLDHDPWQGWTASPSEEAYQKAVSTAREHILAGDIFQVVLSRRWRRMPECTAGEIYRMLRLTNPSPYMFLLDTGQARVLGASPEMLVRVRDRAVTTCPIAGTRRRADSPEADQRLEQELLEDPKERAEHVMLVDLGRNDIGKVSRSGQVVVTREMEVERYSHVMHLVSEVQGQLRDDADAWDALLACFPAGTLSGAPKVRSMEIIDGLEEVRRGVYGGAVGYRDITGALDSCIAIRTMVERGGVVHIQAGAGIVYDSVPASELEECRNKAAVLVHAVAMAEAAARRDRGDS